MHSFREASIWAFSESILSNTPLIVELSSPITPSNCFCKPSSASNLIFIPHGKVGSFGIRDAIDAALGNENGSAGSCGSASIMPCCKPSALCRAPVSCCCIFVRASNPEPVAVGIALLTICFMPLRFVIASVRLFCTVPKLAAALPTEALAAPSAPAGAAPSKLKFFGMLSAILVIAAVLPASASPSAV